MNYTGGSSMAADADYDETFGTYALPSFCIFSTFAAIVVNSSTFSNDLRDAACFQRACSFFAFLSGTRFKQEAAFAISLCTSGSELQVACGSSKCARALAFLIASVLRSGRK